MKAQSKPNSIDAYLAGVKPDQQAALQALRDTIRATAPKAEECISYGLAAFRLDGRPLVAFGAGDKHCAFYPMSSTTVADHKEELQGYDTSKGTIRFQPDKPLPVALVRKLIKARMKENAGTASRKPAKPSAKKPKVRSTQEDTAVSAFLKALDHPLKKDIEAVRQIILGASADIHEGIKWNAPSFRTTEFFATVNTRSLATVQLVFHLGAKVKDNSTKGLTIADPDGLIRWLAKDRCLVTVGKGQEIAARRAVLAAIVRQWIGQM